MAPDIVSPLVNTEERDRREAPLGSDHGRLVDKNLTQYPRCRSAMGGLPQFVTSAGKRCRRASASGKIPGGQYLRLPRCRRHVRRKRHDYNLEPAAVDAQVGADVGSRSVRRPIGEA